MMMLGKGASGESGESIDDVSSLISEGITSVTNG